MRLRARRNRPCRTPAGGVALASQLAGPLALDIVPRRLDRRRAAEYLTLRQAGPERTFFDGIRRLPPGHTLTAAAAGPLRLERYWSPRPASGLAFAGLEDWAAALGSELEHAVERRARCWGGLATQLSGGLDSSAVTCLAAPHLPPASGPLRAISFSAPPEGDGIVLGDVVDAEYIRAVAAFSGAVVHHPSFRPPSFREALARSAPGMMPPFLDSGPAHRWASRQGIRVILSGWGGDEAASYNGRGYPAGLALRFRWLALLRLLAELKRRGGVRRPRRYLLHRVLMPLLPDLVVRWLNAALLQDPRYGWSFDAAISPELLRESGIGDHPRPSLRERPGVHSMQRRLLECGYLTRRIEVTSADASRHGLEYRYPLLDPRLIELALALPEEAFIREGINRWVFRRALVGRVPAEVLWRPDKRDSWSQRHLDSGRRQKTTVALRPQVERLLKDGNDLGGCVSLDRLRRSLAEMPEEGAPPSSGMGPLTPFIGPGLAVRLAAFVELNQIDCG